MGSVGSEAVLNFLESFWVADRTQGWIYAVVTFAIHERILSVLEIHLNEDHSKSLACSWSLERRNIAIAVSSLR